MNCPNGWEFRLRWMDKKHRWHYTTWYDCIVKAIRMYLKKVLIEKRVWTGIYPMVKLQWKSPNIKNVQERGTHLLRLQAWLERMHKITRKDSDKIVHEILKELKK